MQTLNPTMDHTMTAAARAATTTPNHAARTVAATASVARFGALADDAALVLHVRRTASLVTGVALLVLGWATGR